MRYEVSRHQCFGRGVKTPFGTVYQHIDVDGEGNVTGMSISYPGKFEDTEIGNMLDQLSQTTRDIIREDL